MIEIEIGGTELARVLIYYRLIQNADFSDSKIICPFHADKNPSLMINLQSGDWFCFGCQEGGNALDFVLKYEKTLNKNADDLQSCKKFFRILKSKEVSNIIIEQKAIKKKSSKTRLLIAKDYYYGLKQDDWTKVKEPDKKEALQYMLNRGFDAVTLNKAGMRFNYSLSYPLIFPMLDNGVFKGWVCRTNNKKVEEYRKYLYNEGFSRRNTLCGTYERGKPVVIVEGYMDRLKLIKYGIKNVVAILGWKITKEQIDKLRSEGVSYIICATDNDKCGKSGYEYIKQFFPTVRWCFLKNIKDCGEMNQETFNKMYIKTKQRIREEFKNGIN